MLNHVVTVATGVPSKNLETLKTAVAEITNGKVKAA